MGRIGRDVEGVPLKETFFRRVFLAAALANGGGAGALLLFHRRILEMGGVAFPPYQEYPVFPAFFQSAAALSMVFGIGYYMVYRRPLENLGIIKIGLWGKLIFALLIIYYTAFMDLSPLFLPAGLFDLTFAFLFGLYCMKHSGTFTPDGPIGPGEKEALILYFSMTDQAERVAEAMGRRLKERGWKVESVRIEPESDLFTFPFRSPLQFFRITWLVIANRKVPIRPVSIPEGRYSLVIIGGQTWWVNLSLPVKALFRMEGAKGLLEGRDVVTYVVCRGLWRRSLAQLNHLVRGAGGRVVRTGHFTHQGRDPMRFITMAVYLLTGREPGFYHYGLGESAINRAEGLIDEVLKGRE